MPWTQVTRPQAQAACAAIGASLCTEAEWQRACETSAGSPCFWSFDAACRTYSATKCNGNDFDTNPATPAVNDDAVLATGSMPMCYANWGGMMSNRIFDMSGNVEEWTTPRAAGVNPIRGGSTNDTQGGMRCQFNFVVADDTFQFPSVGFRCCRSTMP
jgi:formylglycine-generating enzyme required for sulfatase activity